MRFTKIFIFLTLSLAVGFWGCTKDQKSEAPKQEQITKNLIPPKVEIKGQTFGVELTDLKVMVTINPTSKEVIETPNLRGGIKITNNSKDVLDIQGVTLEYFNEAGKLIPFSSAQKIVEVNPFWKALQPGDSTEGTLDVTLPKNAVQEKALCKIEVNLVYVTSPLKRETVTLSEKVE